MENFEKVQNSKQLNNVLEAAYAAERLIILVYFTKNIPECRQVYQILENIAREHMLTYFCIIDMDKFEDESKYTSNVSNMPKLDCYYMNNLIGSYPASTVKDIKSIIKYGEQYVMMQINNKNNTAQNSHFSVPYQINPLQIQQQILTHAKTTNPTQYTYLMQNPAILQQLVQNQIASSSQQQQQFFNTPQNIMQNQLIQSTPYMQQQQQMPQYTQIPQQQYAQMINSQQQNLVQTPITNNCSNSSNQDIYFQNGLPTFQQMQQMFQIFQMMQQMGILNVNTNKNDIISDKSTEKIQNTDKEDVVILPNGDKIIPLANGKFALVKKNN